MFGGHAIVASSPQGRFAEGAELLSGRVLEGTDAWGKHLFHRYAGDLWLHIHLGLYGKFADGPLPAPEPRGALRLRIEAAEHWLDLRGPIRCEVLTTAEKRLVTADLGPDPLRPDADSELAARRLARSRTAVGALLMNQTVLAGVGNVYRAEILFRHRVSPFLPGRDLAPQQWAPMWADLVTLMRAGVRSGRIVTTERADRERSTGPARRTDAHYVYRRTGQPCRVCDTPIAQAVMVARNLFWCPRCQPDP
jgi:endonuclease-8